MPPTLNKNSGQTSVCNTPWAVKARSSSLPGNVEARGANESPCGSMCFSAISKAAMNETINKIPWINNPGPSIATEPWATIWRMPLF